MTLPQAISLYQKYYSAKFEDILKMPKKRFNRDIANIEFIQKLFIGGEGGTEATDPNAYSQQLAMRGLRTPNA